MLKKKNIIIEDCLCNHGTKKLILFDNIGSGEHISIKKLAY